VVTLGGPGGRLRCLVVWGGAAAALAAAMLLTRAGVAEGASAIGAHRLGALPFDRALADLAAALLLGCAAWLWLVTSYVVIEAARGRTAPRRAPRWMPVRLRRLVLSACGVAVAGALLPPTTAIASGGHHHHPTRVVVRSPVAGLPVPERATITGHRRPVPTPDPHDLTAATVVVAPGDTLWSIAARHLPPDAPDALVARRWRAIYAANRGRIGPDPDLIQPGLHLHLRRKDLS
jgi:hypothetical protein